MRNRIFLLTALLLSACIPSNDYQTLHDGDIGITVDYPVNYTMDMFQQTIVINAEGDALSFPTVHIGDGVPEGQVVQIFRTPDSRILSYLQTYMPFTTEREINGQRYQQFQFVGLGDQYGYVTEKDGQYYVFESTWGPNNPVAERMVNTLILQ